MPCSVNGTSSSRLVAQRPELTFPDTLMIARSMHAIFSPGDRSSYANIGFSLLGLALERALGISYVDSIRALTSSIGMESTSITKPDDSCGIIPTGPSTWDVDLGNDAPTGAVYSTANDLSAYLRSVLSPTLLSQSKVNDWLQPHSWTSSGSSSAYGMPWEIYRASKLTADNHSIDLVTKGGDLPGYHSIIALIPELNIGLTILTAGDTGAVFELRDKLIPAIVRAVEELLRASIKGECEGLYVPLVFEPPLDTQDGVQINVSGSGVHVVAWRQESTDFLQQYSRLKGMPDDPSQWTAKLVPTNQRQCKHNGDEYGCLEFWRLTGVPVQSPEDSANVFNDVCETDVDYLAYGGLSLEEFVLGGPVEEHAQGLITLGARGLFIYDGYDDARVESSLGSGLQQLLRAARWLHVEQPEQARGDLLNNIQGKLEARGPINSRIRQRSRHRFHYLHTYLTHQHLPNTTSPSTPPLPPSTSSPSPP